MSLAHLLALFFIRSALKRHRTLSAAEAMPEFVCFPEPLPIKQAPRARCQAVMRVTRIRRGTRVRCAGDARRASDRIRTRCALWLEVSHESSSSCAQLRAYQIAKNLHTSKMPSSSGLPLSELELSHRVPAQGEHSFLSFLPPVPLLGRAAAPILGGLLPMPPRAPASLSRPSGNPLECGRRCAQLCRHRSLFVVCPELGCILQARRVVSRSYCDIC